MPTRIDHSQRVARIEIPFAGGLVFDAIVALTERELELAALVAHGRTNRQIAASAYLSEKVERQLAADRALACVGRRDQAGKLGAWIPRSCWRACRARSR